MKVQVLNPRSAWADKAAYDARAADLARRSCADFERYADQAPPGVAAAGPRVF